MTGTLHAALYAAAGARPDHVAVVHGRRRLTYRELAARSAALAHRLAGLGVRRGDRVGVLVEKSVETLVAVYGVLTAGAAYVPLAPKQPGQRQAHIVAAAGIRVVVTVREPCPDGVAVVDLAEPDPGGPPAGPPVVTGADDLAYVLFTSGSTGRPKGVALTHRNALSFVDWAVAEFGVGRDDRLANHAPLTFDLAVFDLFAAARAAATVVLVPRSAAAFPRELADFLRRHRVTVWYSVPSALHLLAARGGLMPGALPDLRLVLFAGEVFPVPQLRALMALVPDARYANLYGPTETNVCTFHRVPNPLPASCRALPVGVPITGVEVSAHAEDGTPVPDGELGELWVRGPTVMRGYLGEPAPPVAGTYRTGDLGHRDTSGVWWFAGRRDAQIKSRGYRVELGEVEAALHRHPGVVECAAVAVPDGEIGNRIVAHVVLRDGVTVAQLRTHARRTLPNYMVPSSFEPTAALPRTATGKVDHRCLNQMSTVD